SQCVGEKANTAKRRAKQARFIPRSFVSWLRKEEPSPLPVQVGQCRSTARGVGAELALRTGALLTDPDELLRDEVGVAEIVEHGTDDLQHPLHLRPGVARDAVGAEQPALHPMAAGEPHRRIEDL